MSFLSIKDSSDTHTFMSPHCSTGELQLIRGARLKTGKIGYQALHDCATWRLRERDSSWSSSPGGWEILLTVAVIYVLIMFTSCYPWINANGQFEMRSTTGRPSRVQKMPQVHYFALRRDELQVHTPHTMLKGPPVWWITFNKRSLCSHNLGHYTSTPQFSPPPDLFCLRTKGIHNVKAAILWRLPLKKANCGLDSQDHKKETQKTTAAL